MSQGSLGMLIEVPYVRRIDLNKPNYAYEYLLTYANGRQGKLIRAARRRTVERATAEVLAKKGVVAVEVLRSLTAREYKEIREAEGIEVPSLANATEAEAEPQKISGTIYRLAVQVAALEGRDTTASLDDLIRPVLEAALREQARKILGA